MEILFYCILFSYFAIANGIEFSNVNYNGEVVQLNNGQRMPLLGLGTWKSGQDKVRLAVYEAIKMGYRHIDAAWVYDNEDEVGEGIEMAIKEGIIRREDLWVTSKLWNTFHSKEQVEPHLRESLRKLKLEYLDLYLVHWPCTDIEGPRLEPSIEETWLAMEELVRKGLVRSIGVSNFSIKKLLDMKNYATIFPAVNQVELHPLLRQDNLLRSCSELGVHVTAYSPLGSPDSAEMLHHEGSTILEHPVVEEVSKETKHTPGQVLLRWAVQRGTSVVPKSTSPVHLQENLLGADPRIYNSPPYWHLSQDQMSRLSLIEPQKRMIKGNFFLSANGPYRTLEELWDQVSDTDVFYREL